MGNIREINRFLKKWDFLVILYITTFLVLIVAVNNISNSQLKAGDVSPKTYTATRNIENEIATKRNQELAKAEVQTVYIIDESKNQEIQKRTDDFFAQVDLARTIYNRNREQFKIQLEGFVNGSVDQNGELVQAPTQTEEDLLRKQVDKLMANFYNMQFDLKKITASDLEYILSMSSEDYATFKGIIEKCIKEVTQNGLTNSVYEAGEFFENSSTEVSIYEALLVNDVVGAIVEPNVSVDVEATQEAMEKAVRNVEPVVYQKGQTIVSAGEVITEEQLQVLIKLNLVGNFGDLEVESVIAYFGILAIIYCIIGLVFLREENKKFFANNYKLMFVVLNILMLIGLVTIPKEYTRFSPLFILAFVLASLFNNYISLLMTIVYTMLYALLGRSVSVETLFLMLTSSITSIIVSSDIQRFRLVKTSLILSFVSGILYFLLNIVFKFQIIVPVVLLKDSIIVTLFVLVCTIFANGVMPFLEASFNLFTAHRLQDLINQERPIFKRMLAETPGTFHHSLVVANLCEAGAKAINADAMLAKTYGYYHDIGKLSAPMYFIENQIGYNYHDDLECKESAKVITNHVDYGVQIRKEYKLPRFIDDAILCHHGTSILQYFYRKALDGEKQEDVNIEDYTYTGAIPFTKELTILMLADIVEAGVRSIIPKVSDFKEVEDFIEKVIDGKMKEGQFDDSNLTFSEIAKVKTAFISVLKGMYHNRITYPS